MSSDQNTMYSIVNSQNGMFPHMMPSNNFDISSELDAKHQPAKANVYDSNTFRPFPSYINGLRQRHHPSQSVPHQPQIRDSAYYSGSDMYNMTSPVPSQMPQAFELGSNPTGLAGTHGFKGFHESFGHASSALQPSQLLPNLNGKGNMQQPAIPNKSSFNPASQYHTAVQITSQTPYGPHIPFNSSSISNNGINNINGVNAPQNVPASSGASSTNMNGSNQEEICTIFVVGFPDDMQEREFQNMFTFSPGFEAATLKIPNKDNTTYSSNPARAYGGSNDPYNLVTVNQGGVVVDGGRDGTMSSWPPGDEASGAGHNAPPRKQIIGFAKFKTRPDALAAREVLQGKRIDMEKGAVLKAEMAKKNLHTKRGIGSIPTNNAVPSLTVGGAAALPGMGTNLHAFQQAAINGLSNGADPYPINAAEPINAATAMNLNRLGQWKDPSHTLMHEPTLNLLQDEEVRRRETSVGTMGLSALQNRTLRERVDDEERRRKDKEMRQRAGLTTFDPFNSYASASYLDVARQPMSVNGLLGPAENNIPETSPIFTSGFASQQDEMVGPWDNIKTSEPVNSSGNTQHTQPSSQRSASPVLNPSYSLSTSSDGTILPVESSDSLSSLTAVGSQKDSFEDADTELIKTMNGLSLATNNGNTSPQLPSPASNSSSTGTRTIDQNPPINTLYVGNLPTSPTPTGCSPDQLKDKLRELFSSQPGFRRLCFRTKNNGPMCFVEFEDVQYATKALHDLHGHNLDGLVKGAGIRLSYSKNPLGVRTPTSVGGGQMQQQQSQFSGNTQLPLEGFQPRLTDDAKSGTIKREVAPTSPPAQGIHGPFGTSFLASPPPRFFSSSPSALTPFSTPASSLATPGSLFSRNSVGNIMNLYNPTSNFSPFGSASQPIIPNHQVTSPAEQNLNNSHTVQQHFSHGAISPPATNLEAARAG